MKTIKLHKLQAGIGLVEIMIASVIGLFLMGGLMQMFITSKQTYKMQDTISRLQENGRFALDFLIRDIRGTNSWGCFSDTTTVANFLNAGGVFDTFNTGLTGADDHVPAGAGDLVLEGTDTLSVISVTPLRDDTTGAEVVITSAAADASDTAADLQVSGNSSLKTGDIVFVSDCDLGDVFQVTNISTAGGVDTLAHANTINPSPGNSTNDLSKVYPVGSNLYKVSFFTYEIRNGESGQPALFRTTNDGVAEELIEGVENMQILYGEDIDADGSPNRYVAAIRDLTTGDLVVNMNQVVSIKISLVVRSLEDKLTGVPVAYNLNNVSVLPTDTRIRRVFSSVITVRNRLI